MPIISIFILPNDAPRSKRGEKISAFLYLLIFALFCSPPCSAEQEVTWGYMAGAAPINWLENGQPMGIEVEVVELVLDRLGLEVKHQFFPWERAQRYVAEGRLDGMMTTPTANRFKYAVFGKENTLPNYWNLFIRKNDQRMKKAIKSINSIEDLKAYGLVDFIGNGWTKAFIKSRGKYNILEVRSLSQIPLTLAKGRQDLIINSSSWTNWWAEKNGVADQLLEIEIDWPWTRFHFVFMLSRKSPWVEKGLIRAMDRELKKIKDEGLWLEILRKYKNPHGLGKPFKSHLGEQYLSEGGFYEDYEAYPIYQPAPAN